MKVTVVFMCVLYRAKKVTLNMLEIECLRSMSEGGGQMDCSKDDNVRYSLWIKQ